LVGCNGSRTKRCAPRLGCFLTIASETLVNVLQEFRDARPTPSPHRSVLSVVTNRRAGILACQQNKPEGRHSCLPAKQAGGQAFLPASQSVPPGPSQPHARESIVRCSIPQYLVLHLGRFSARNDSAETLSIYCRPAASPCNRETVPPRRNASAACWRLADSFRPNGGNSVSRALAEEVRFAMLHFAGLRCRPRKV
jgi:hypothetical protein